MNIEKEFKKLKDLISHIMKNYPETRDSDTLLYIKCCEYLGATTLDDLKKLNLNIVSLHKARQIIQNKDLLYPPSEEVLAARSKRGVEIKEYMSRLA